MSSVKEGNLYILSNSNSNTSTNSNNNINADSNTESWIYCHVTLNMSNGFLLYYVESERDGYVTMLL